MAAKAAGDDGGNPREDFIAIILDAARKRHNYGDGAASSAGNNHDSILHVKNVGMAANGKYEAYTCAAVVGVTEAQKQEVHICQTFSQI